MIIENSFSQGTDEWLAARLKSIGGTSLQKIIKSNGDRSDSRDNFVIEFASRVLTGREKPLYPTYEMKWGHEFEPKARSAYSFAYECEVSECAMIWLDDKKNQHVSPDGYVHGGKRGLEIKCPQLKEFMRLKKSGFAPAGHRTQIQHGLSITGWDRWDYVVYFPGLAPMIVEYGRDEKLISKIKMETSAFLYDVNKLIERISK